MAVDQSPPTSFRLGEFTVHVVQVRDPSHPTGYARQMRHVVMNDVPDSILGEWQEPTTNTMTSFCDVELVAFSIPGEPHWHYISRPCEHGLIFMHPGFPLHKLDLAELFIEHGGEIPT